MKNKLFSKFSWVTMLFLLFLVSAKGYSQDECCLTIQTDPPRAYAHVAIWTNGFSDEVIMDENGQAYYCFPYGNQEWYITVNDIDCPFPPCVTTFVPCDIYKIIYVDSDCGCERDNNILKPSSFNLYQNYPNPFNPVTTISFEIPRDGHVKLYVYDLSGKLLENLVDRILEAGKHSADFDGSNLSSGVYFYKIETPDFTSIRKMMLIK